MTQIMRMRLIKCKIVHTIFAMPNLFAYGDTVPDGRGWRQHQLNNERERERERERKRERKKRK
jgi:hypothetical protein